MYKEASTTMTCSTISWMSRCHGMANLDCRTSVYLRSSSKHNLELHVHTYNIHRYYNTFNLRDITAIREFTRGTLSALLVNIESREWQRQYNLSNGIPPEHPRASTTDDVECFFSVFRDMVGKDFTHKEVLTCR